MSTSPSLDSNDDRVLTGSAAGDTFLVPEPHERHKQRMLFHTLPGYSPRLRWTEADDAVEADDYPPGNDGQKMLERQFSLAQHSHQE